MKKTAILLLVLLAASVPALAQSADEMNKFRIAQALEQAGEYQKALEFYRQLYDATPSNYVYFDGLRKTLMNLKNYAAAEGLIRQRLAREPSNVTLYCELGDALFKSGEQDSALAIWNRGLNVDPGNSSAYQAVADMMAQDRLFADAIGVYKKGEATTDQKTGFIVQIARLYFLNMNYGDGLAELLKLLKSDNASSAMAYIQSQLGAYSTSMEAVKAFTTEMKKRTSADSDNLAYRQILAFLYMEQKDYDGAYDLYKWIDRHLGSDGGQLLVFAERAYNDEAYAVSARAFREVAGLSKIRQIVAESWIGYANSLRRLGEKNYADDKSPCSPMDSLKELNASLAAYQTVLSDFPETEFYNIAALSSIEIQMNYFRDLNAAEKLFSGLRNMEGQYAREAALLRMKLFVMEGKFTDAISLAESEISAERNGGMSPDENYADQLKFEVAQSLYYTGKFDSASALLKDVMDNPMSDAANEAIQLSNVIENNKPVPDALMAYASAAALEATGRLPEAAAQYEEVIKTFPSAPLADNARFNLAETYCRIGQVADALKWYSALASDSLGIYADRAQFRIARIYQLTLHDTSRATSEYENFLARFPNSIYQDRVRSILRALLGNNS